MLILSLLTLLHFVAANSLLSITHPSSAFTVRDLVLARQSSTSTGNTVPPACKADCDPINARVVEGCTPQDCCQSSFVTEYFTCLKCVGGALNITDFTPAQRVLDDLTVQCDSRGLNAPKLTLPGEDPNRTLPSAPATATVSNLSATLPSFAGTAAPSPTSSTAAQSTNTPSSAEARRLIPHFSHVHASAALLGGLIHLVL